MDSIEKRIIDKLYETEESYDVKIIYAIESGSRGWGFASPDSDYDCRFIYVNKRDWYLSVENGKDFIEYPVDRVFDVNGWDIKKALKQIKKSNPTLMEWLSSPIVYIENRALINQLRLLAAQYFNEVHGLHHYLSLAKNSMEAIKADNETRLKKYFYVMRSLACCQYIVKYNIMPPMEYEKTISAIDIAPNVRNEISKLIDKKRTADEDETIKRNDLLYSYFGDIIVECEKAANEMHHEKNVNLTPLDNYLRLVVSEAWL